MMILMAIPKIKLFCFLMLLFLKIPKIYIRSRIFYSPVMLYYLRYFFVWLLFKLHPQLHALSSTFKFKSWCGFDDIDMNLHMNNASYLRVFEYARWKLYLESGLFSVCHKQGGHPVVASISVAYKRELFLFKSFEIKTRITGIKGPWIFLEQSMFDGNQKLLCRASLKILFLNKRTKIDALELIQKASEIIHVSDDWVESLNLNELHNIHLRVERELKEE
ncbi:hypothetical protein RCL1_001842 [Eukaryota sp. TZLM3-RCL]